jgi:hypothetical protein
MHASLIWLVCGAIAFNASSVAAQPNDGVKRIGFLSSGYRDSSFGWRSAILGELGKAGYFEGSNLVI